MEALKAGSKKSTGGTAQAVVDLIGKLYHLEKQARDAKLNADQIRAMRQEKAKSIMARIKALLLEREKTTPPKSLLGKAIAYALGQWDRVAIYSLIETAKANGLEPLRYLHFVFEKLPLAKSQEDLRALLPQHLDSKSISV